MMGSADSKENADMTQLISLGLYYTHRFALLDVMRHSMVDGHRTNLDVTWHA